ncbi:hypothetical protein HOLleu_42337 [Holothuria leucospilota]|uniref:GIY-YIG domain-containing protein n=1 Tax=Holothuria leucospilota TaxID=206669 RepID=A0A9Q0YBQ9_HOLLE|nr:hypothetical protein HOLleu_42337 [Holothuria leucospilota]
MFVYIYIYIVYIFYCTICNSGNYVGETGTAFRSRFNNHKKSIRDNLRFPSGGTFNLPNHSLENLKCIPLGSNFSSSALRKGNEIEWILRINSFVQGINKDLGVTFWFYHLFMLSFIS